jgi:hypothetical protein
MRKTLIAAAFVTAFAAGPALADCAGDLTKIDEAMKTLKLDETTGAKAKEVLDKAKAAQAASDEATCTASTAEVMKLLGMAG